MKTNDTIKVHLYDLSNREIRTRNYDKTFCVYEKTENLELTGTQKKARTPARVMCLHHSKPLRNL